MILDTNYLGALDAGKTGARDLAEKIESNSLPARIPTPVVFEVFYGIEGAENPVIIKAITTDTDRCPTVPVRRNRAVLLC